MENNFIKKSLQDKLSQARKDIEFQNTDLQGKLKFVRDQIKSNEDTISKGDEKYLIKDAHIEPTPTLDKEELNTEESIPEPEPEIEVKKDIKENKWEKYIIEIGEDKLQEVREEAVYLMQNNLNINNIDQKMKEAEEYFDSMPDSNGKENLIKKINQLKKEIENYRTFGIFNKEGNKLGKNEGKEVPNVVYFGGDGKVIGPDDSNYENAKKDWKEAEKEADKRYSNEILNNENKENNNEEGEYVDFEEIKEEKNNENIEDDISVESIGEEEIDKGFEKLDENADISENSEEKRKGRVVNMFQKISDAVKKKKEALIIKLKKVKIKESKKEEPKEEDEKKRKEEIKKRAKNIKKIRKDRISEEKRNEREEKEQKEKEEREERNRERKEEADKKKEERKAKKEKEKREKREELKRRQRFEGDWHFEEDFQGKEKGNFISKKIKKYRLNRDRKNINNIYQKNIKPLNDRYFNDILGEENIKILRKLEGQEKINKEKEILENFIENIKNAKEEIIDRKNEFIDIRERANLFKKYNLTEVDYKKLEKELREIEEKEEKILEKNDLSKEEYESIKRERNIKKRNNILQNYGLTEIKYQELKKEIETIQSKAIHAKYGFSEKDYKKFSSKMEKEEEWNILKKYNLSLELYERFKREEDQKDLLNKLNIKLNAEEKIQEIRNENDIEIKANIERKRYAEYIEKDINYYKNKLEEAKAKGLAGDKEYIKRLKSKIKALDKIKRIKLEKEIRKNIKENIESEFVKVRKEKMNTLTGKEKYKKMKSDFKDDLIEDSANIWDSVSNKMLGSFSMTDDKSFINRSKEFAGGAIGGIFGLLKLLFNFGINTGKLGYRYIKK